MAVRVLKPNISARRNMSVSDFSEITKTKPKKSLLIAKKQKSGRNNQGKITVRHRGGGAKRAIRMVDFRFSNVQGAEVVGIEYDPNRSARLALLKLPNNKYSYIIATSNMKIGSIISSNSKDVEIKEGNRASLATIPQGSIISNIELTPNKGAQLVRSAGAKAQLLSKDGDYVQVKLPSGEIRKIHNSALATIGAVGNEAHQNIKIGSAGRKRHMGIRPTVRGKAMNPVDHPHGGGEGGSPIGLKSAKSPWGVVALGKKTRRRKSTSAMIIKSAKRGNRR